eukprot:SAG22_NODE_9_length_35992_cov_37.278104_15_plen_198_part_00
MTRMIEQLQIQFVADDDVMEVTGLLLGYRHNHRQRVWEEKFARGLRNLRCWMRVRLSVADRVLIFRAFVMSVWAYTARPQPPGARLVKKMEALRRRWVLTGSVPAGDGMTAFTTNSKVSSDEIARPAEQGGQSLPTVSHWLDELHIETVRGMLDPQELTQTWTQYPIAAAAEAIGVWGAVSTTGPATLPGALSRQRQ